MTFDLSPAFSSFKLAARLTNDCINQGTVCLPVERMHPFARRCMHGRRPSIFDCGSKVTHSAPRSWTVETCEFDFQQVRQVGSRIGAGSKSSDG